MNPYIDSYGSKYWYNEERQLHRLDGPAVIDHNGNKRWYQNGILHRLDGPAIENINGDKIWYQNGKRHRLDGPAIEWASGHKYWYINDKELTEEEFNKQKLIELEPMISRFLAIMDELNG